MMALTCVWCQCTQVLCQHGLLMHSMGRIPISWWEAQPGSTIGSEIRTAQLLQHMQLHIDANSSTCCLFVSVFNGFGRVELQCTKREHAQMHGSIHAGQVYDFRLRHPPDCWDPLECSCWKLSWLMRARLGSDAAVFKLQYFFLCQRPLQTVFKLTVPIGCEESVEPRCSAKQTKQQDHHHKKGCVCCSCSAKGSCICCHPSLSHSCHRGIAQPNLARPDRPIIPPVSEIAVHAVAHSMESV